MDPRRDSHHEKADIKMGVDSSIFAKDSKRSFYFDRDRNFRVWDLEWDDKKYAEIKSKLDRHVPVTSDEVIYMAEKNITYWETQETQEYRANWNRSIIKFVKEHPNDNFMVYTDHESPDSHDISKVGGYTEWEDKDV